MFSKPIAIAASVASAQAALMAVTTTVNPGTLSDATGCGTCLSWTTSTWISAGASAAAATKGTYKSPASVSAVSIATNTLTGEICCKEAASTESAVGTATAVATYCTGAFATNAANTYTTYTANDYFQATLAQCPHHLDNCVAAAVDKAAATISITDQRYVALDALGSSVTLSYKTVVPGTAPSLKQKKGDVCTWVVAAKCDAPVVTVPTGSAVMTASPNNEFEVQVTEWSNEFLSADTWLATAESGATGKLYYPPLSVNLDAKITDLLATATTLTTPNNMYGDVSFKLPDKDGSTYSAVPGNTLLDWMANIKAVYDSYTAEVTKYDAENALWKTYAEYSAPAPGIFDWLIAPAEDENKPKTVSKPLQPTQPVAVPTTIGQLALSVTTTVNKAEYKDKSGYGYPVAYQLVPLADKSIKPFGTLAGGGIASAATTAITTSDKGYSMRKTTNKDSTQTGGYKATCDTSFLMITTWLKIVPTAAKEFKIVVTAEEFASTLEETIPTRPGAVTAPVAAPAGAAQLAASAVAAALTALYLF